MTTPSDLSLQCCDFCLLPTSAQVANKTLQASDNPKDRVQCQQTAIRAAALMQLLSSQAKPRSAGWQAPRDKSPRDSPLPGKAAVAAHCLTKLHQIWWIKRPQSKANDESSKSFYAVCRVGLYTTASRMKTCTGLSFCFKIKLCKKSWTKTELKTSEHRKTLTSFCYPLLLALPGSCCQQLSDCSLRNQVTAANTLYLQHRSRLRFRCSSLLQVQRMLAGPLKPKRERAGETRGRLLGEVIKEILTTRGPRATLGFSTSSPSAYYFK